MQVYSGIDESTKIVLICPYYLLTVTMTIEWISGDGDPITSVYSTATTDRGVIYHSIKFSEPVTFTEVLDQAGWGTLYYAMKNVSRRDGGSFRLVTHSRLYRRAMSHTQDQTELLTSRIL
jgi:hypothetical protein